MKPYRTPETSRGEDTARVERFRLAPRRSRVLQIVLLTSLMLVLLWACHDISPEMGAVYAPVLFVAAVVVGVAIVWTRAAPLARENKEAVAQLLAGDVDGAVRAFESLIARSGRVPSYRAQFTANLGAALYRRGDTSEAIRLLEDVYASGWMSTKRARENWLYLLVALASARIVRGDAASRDLERANELRTAARPLAQDSNRGLLVVADALFAARSGNFKEVEAVCSSGWAAAEGVARPIQMRTLRILRAFALEHAKRADAAADDADVHSWLEGAKPARPGEFDHLAATWPEMRAFLDAHGFAGSPNTDRVRA